MTLLVLFWTKRSFKKSLRTTSSPGEMILWKSWTHLGAEHHATAAAYPGGRRVPYGQTKVVFFQEIEVVTDFFKQILSLGVFLQIDKRNSVGRAVFCLPSLTGQGRNVR